MSWAPMLPKLRMASMFFNNPRDRPLSLSCSIVSIKAANVLPLYSVRSIASSERRARMFAYSWRSGWSSAINAFRQALQ